MFDVHAVGLSMSFHLPPFWLSHSTRVPSLANLPDQGQVSSNMALPEQGQPGLQEPLPEEDQAASTDAAASLLGTAQQGAHSAAAPATGEHTVSTGLANNDAALQMEGRHPAGEGNPLEPANNTPLANNAAVQQPLQDDDLPDFEAVDHLDETPAAELGTHRF
eukprot:6468499-Amphidinium_carterae.1